MYYIYTSSFTMLEIIRYVQLYRYLYKGILTILLVFQFTECVNIILLKHISACGVSI